MFRTRARLIASVSGLVLVGSALTACEPGTTHTGQATYYQGGSSGGACGFTQDVGVHYGAMNAKDYENARACGGFARVKGPEGTVTVQIVDVCPECAPGDIDLSPQAFDAIAARVAGRVPISWQYVSSSDARAVQYVVKEGSNQWWFAIQARRHRHRVTTLEVQVGTRWVALQRQSYNYFVSDAGFGPGPFTIRLTDVHGQQLVHTGIRLAPGEVQTTSSQFASVK